MAEKTKGSGTQQKKIVTEVDEKKLEKLETKVTDTVEVIENFKITDDKQMAYASELLSQANREMYRLTADKESLTKPLNKVLNGIRKRYKPAETKLQRAITILRKEIGTYQTQLDEAAEEKRKKISGRVGAGRGKLSIETAGKQLAEVTGPEKKVETASGSISFREDYEILSVDVRKLPEQFIKVDEAGIKKALKAGGEVAGVEFKKIKTPINRRN